MGIFLDGLLVLTSGATQWNIFSQSKLVKLVKLNWPCWVLNEVNIYTRMIWLRRFSSCRAEERVAAKKFVCERWRALRSLTVLPFGRKRKHLRWSHWAIHKSRLFESNERLSFKYYSGIHNTLRSCVVSQNFHHSYFTADQPLWHSFENLCNENAYCTRRNRQFPVIVRTKSR